MLLAFLIAVGVAVAASAVLYAILLILGKLRGVGVDLNPLPFMAFVFVLAWIALCLPEQWRFIALATVAAVVLAVITALSLEIFRAEAIAIGADEEGDTAK